MYKSLQIRIRNYNRTDIYNIKRFPVYLGRGHAKDIIHVPWLRAQREYIINGIFERANSDLIAYGDPRYTLKLANIRRPCSIGNNIQLQLIKSAKQPVINSYQEDQQYADNLKGIDGWLIVVAIGLLINPLLLILQFFLNYVSVDEVMRMSYSPYLNINVLKIYLLSILFLTMLGFMFFVPLNILFYSRKAIFPKLMIFFYIYNFAVAFLIFISNSFLTNQFSFPGLLYLVLQPLIGCLIWIPYFLKSVRVKNTFVN